MDTDNLTSYERYGQPFDELYGDLRESETEQEWEEINNLAE